MRWTSLPGEGSLVYACERLCLLLFIIIFFSLRHISIFAHPRTVAARVTVWEGLFENPLNF